MIEIVYKYMGLPTYTEAYQQIEQQTQLLLNSPPPGSEPTPLKPEHRFSSDDDETK